MRETIRFSHVINTFVAPPNSEHERAQRVTFASLRRAVFEAAKHGLEVEVLAVVLAEDTPSVELPAKCIPTLSRTVLDFGTFHQTRKMPLLMDLLTQGASAGKGDYLIYTNADIALQPHFYVSVSQIIAGKTDFCGVINRRSISANCKGPADMEAMYQEDGEIHPGYDCFIFPRAWVERLVLGHVCIGIRHFDGLLIANLDLLSEWNLQIYRDLRLTFHLGNDATWESRRDYDEFNLQEAVKALRRLRRDVGVGKHHFKFLGDSYAREAMPDRWLIRRLKRVEALRRIAKILKPRLAERRTARP